MQQRSSCRHLHVCSNASPKQLHQGRDGTSSSNSDRVVCIHSEAHQRRRCTLLNSICGARPQQLHQSRDGTGNGGLVVRILSKEFQNCCCILLHNS
ncbi:hypothetical protein FOA52_014264 [Chlamydomonas sp. UWO 241]|nr:hypothetical protein FOA52_014264 [Chlamydomonas sp. UWO 241]